MTETILTYTGIAFMGGIPAIVAETSKQKIAYAAMMVGVIMFVHGTLMS